MTEPAKPKKDEPVPVWLQIAAGYMTDYNHEKRKVRWGVVVVCVVAIIILALKIGGVLP